MIKMSIVDGDKLQLAYGGDKALSHTLIFQMKFSHHITKSNCIWLVFVMFIINDIYILPISRL